MIHHSDERNQLAALHDRHKRFSIEVYDYQESGETEKLKASRKNLEQTVKELDALKQKLHHSN